MTPASLFHHLLPCRNSRDSRRRKGNLLDGSSIAFIMTGVPLGSTLVAELVTTTTSHVVTSLPSLYNKVATVTPPELKVLFQEISLVILASSFVHLHHTLQAVFNLAGHASVGLSVYLNIPQTVLVRADFLILVSAHLMEHQYPVVLLPLGEWELFEKKGFFVDDLWAVHL